MVFASLMNTAPMNPADLTAADMRRPRHALVRLRQKLLELVFPRVHNRLRRRFYSRSWQRDDYYSPRQFWFLPAGVVPRVVREAVDSGSLGHGGTLLDIGCGNGRVARYLADAGFAVTGVDFAAASIARARSEIGESSRLRFQVLDICEEVPSDAPFDVLFDRGCFHGLPKGQQAAYLRALLACSRPGSRVLLLRRVADRPDVDAEERFRLTALALENARAFFGRHFAIARHEAIWFNNRGDDEGTNALPGLALWMTRTSVAVPTTRLPR